MTVMPSRIVARTKATVEKLRCPRVDLVLLRAECGSITTWTLSSCAEPRLDALHRGALWVADAAVAKGGIILPFGLAVIVEIADKIVNSAPHHRA